MRIKIEENFITLYYKEKARYESDKEENEDIIDNTIEFKDEFVINIPLKYLEEV